MGHLGFTDEYVFQIHDRTMLPDKIGGKALPKDEVFSLSNNIERKERNMKITEEQLERRGFVRKESVFGSYYTLDNFAIVKNVRWQVCNYSTGKPFTTLQYVNTMEELEKMIEESL